LTRIF